MKQNGFIKNTIDDFIDFWDCLGYPTKAIVFSIAGIIVLLGVWFTGKYF